MKSNPFLRKGSNSAFDVILSIGCHRRQGHTPGYSGRRRWWHGGVIQNPPSPSWSRTPGPTAIVVAPNRLNLAEERDCFPPLALDVAEPAAAATVSLVDEVLGILLLLLLLEHLVPSLLSLWIVDVVMMLLLMMAPRKCVEEWRGGVGRHRIGSRSGGSLRMGMRMQVRMRRRRGK